MTVYSPRIGTDVKFLDGRSLWGDIGATLEHVRTSGYDGIGLRTLDEVFPTLDRSEIAEVAAHAAALGLYVEVGIGKVNPFMTAELPRVRVLGDGSYVAGMRRLIEESARVGWAELWSATGGFKPFPGWFFTDRFRTDTDWSRQLEAIERLLHQLAPYLRDHGCHLNLETHEEITSDELVRLVESVGPDVLGVCLDPANLLVHGEDPVAATRRLAPFVRTTQLRDAALWRNPDGSISRFLAPAGLGVIDWPELLAILRSSAPGPDLTIEGVGGTRAEMRLWPDAAPWCEAHPDLRPDEVATVRNLAADYERRASAGEVPAPPELQGDPAAPAAEHDWFVATTAEHLRALLPHPSPAPTLQRTHP